MTNFPYTPTIPDGPNNPSVDQPGMKINAQSINDILSVDHLTFNVNNGGTHKQVSFSSNNVPVFPVPDPLPFPTAFTNSAGGGISQLFLYTGTQFQSADQYTISANGSVLLLGGIILKWATLSAGTTTFASLGLADFPNNAFAAVATPTSFGGFPIAITALTTGSITVSLGPCYVLIIGN